MTVFDSIIKNPVSINQPGVYRIINTHTGDCYVGATGNLRIRTWNHRGQLRRGVSGHRLLQENWNQYSESCFVIEIIRLCNKDELGALEQKSIDLLSPTLNVGSCADKPMTGVNHSAETRKKMSLNRRGKGLGPRPYVIPPCSFPKGHTPWNQGKHHSQSTRNKISAAAKERYKDRSKHPGAHRVQVNGVTYPSKTVAAEAYHVSSCTIAYWVKHGRAARI